MNKKEFLRQLEEELADLSLEERMAALQYFTMYFDDAGPGREQQVIDELGTPKKVAADVRAGSEEGAQGWTPPAKEGGGAPAKAEGEEPPESEAIVLQLEELPSIPDFPDPPAAPQPPPVQQAQPGADTPNAGAGGPVYGYAGSYPAPAPAALPTAQAQAAAPPQQGGANPVKVLLLVLLAVVLFPLAGGILSVLAGITVALLMPVIAGIALGASGVAVIVGGALLTPLSVGNGVLMIGGGILLLGVGLLCAYFGIWVLAKGVPALWRGLGSLIKKIVR